MVKIKSRLQTFLGMVTKVIVARIASSLVRVQVEQLKKSHRLNLCGVVEKPWFDIGFPQARVMLWITQIFKTASIVKYGYNPGFVIQSPPFKSEWMRNYGTDGYRHLARVLNLHNHINNWFFTQRVNRKIPSL